MDESSLSTKTQVLQRLGGDQDLLNELIQMYFEDYPAMVSQLEQANREKNAGLLIRAAHGLKGLLSNFFQTTAATAIHAIEKASRTNDIELASSHFGDLRSDLSQLSLELRKWTSESTELSGESANQPVKSSAR